MLETKIDELIAALDRNTAARVGATSATPAKPAAAKPAATPAKTAAPAAKTSAPAAVVAKAEKAADQALPKVDRKALGTLVTQIADDFLDPSQTDNNGQPLNIGRPRIVALIQEFGAAKLSGVPDARLKEFEIKARALHAELSGAAGGATEESLV